ncbi:nucleoside-diphosphate-sugar epimerase [Sphingomonas vulcanisoli]|uniref:Nucleoside-diphosphate-sugar epimerase n=1 Tax=Sphingomonas vulcanisoli TaxID=1658060 RepID=A0ABX0TZ12_9SPHN|nr:NAD(P)-dependent oxidoreductase [Sphingomonas vulcanisoli]NIJ09454.1 nucleoside-diphosphate-sugar epimerase [Sphingomonas vulcanisoli]
MIKLSANHGLAIERKLADELAEGGRTVVITGASGWLGSATLAMLDASMPASFVMEKLAVFGSSRREIVLPSGRIIQCRPMIEMVETALEHPLLFHYAYLTKDKVAEMSDEAFIALNSLISQTVRTAVEVWRADVFLPSSGGVYRRDGALVSSYEASPYGYLKLADEASFRQVAAQAGSNLYIGRIFSLAGEFINKTSVYALGSIIAAIGDREPIRIRASQGVWRSYFYIGDVVNLALGLLLSGKKMGEPFDIAGDEAIEIGDLARLCSEACGDRGHPIERPEGDFSEGDRMLGDPAASLRLMASLGLKPVALRDQVIATARYLMN